MRLIASHSRCINTVSVKLLIHIMLAIGAVLLLEIIIVARLSFKNHVMKLTRQGDNGHLLKQHSLNTTCLTSGGCVAERPIHMFRRR